MQLNLSEVDESISENSFVSILLKRLPRDFESFCTLVNYGQVKTLDEIKRVSINFESEKCNERYTGKSDSVFFTNDRTCFNCHKRWHIAKFCCVQRQDPNNEKSKPQLTCFNCKIWTYCKKHVLTVKKLENCFTIKNFDSHTMKINAIIKEVKT